MIIEVAASAGYCYGVKRATEMAFEAVKCAKKPIWSLGSVIHNPQVVASLEKAGVTKVSDIGQLSEGTAIVPAHGRKLEDLAELARRGIDIIDATCPHVVVAQKAITELAACTDVIVFLGDPDHPEVKSVVSCAAGANVAIVTGAGDLPPLEGVESAGVIAQTTQSGALFASIASEVKRRVPIVHVRDTICFATRKRQDEAEVLSRRVDAMIVAGGRESANTRRLYGICSANCKKTRLVESADELREEWFEGVGRVGVTAGASTPDWVIDGVVERICGLGGVKG